MSVPANGGQSAPADYFDLAPTNSDSRPKPICLGMSHCRACLFPIDRKTETVVAVTPDDRVSTVFRRNPKISYPRIFSDDSRSMTLLFCANDYCKHLDGLAVAIHVDCANMAAHLGSPLNKYRRCTEYAYQPTKEHQRRRRECIRNLIDNSLRERFSKLPLELCRMVSDDDELIRLYTLAEMSLERRQKDWSIDLTLPVWATYTTIDGVEYVSALSNSQTTKSRRVCQDIIADKVLYISSDHLGIRQILTDPSRAILDEYHPAYWQTVSVESQTLSFTGDGYRLREVVRPSTQPPVFWPSPNSPAPLTLFYPGWGEGAVVARMKALSFNEPDTTGYSICWAGTEMDAIQAHRSTDECNRGGGITSRERSEYEEMGNSKCTYHPIAQDEYVKQVWLRDCIQYDTVKELPYPKESSRFHYHISTPWGTQTYKGLARHKRPSDMALALVTSKGRTIVAGNHPDHGFHAPEFKCKRQWCLVSETETHAPMTIFIALPTHGIPLFAAPKLSGNEQRHPPPKQSSIGRMPNFNPLFTLHYSSASLENVTSVTVCRSRNVKDEGTIRHFILGNSRFDEWKYKKVAGLLFKYADGHEESVGCFRFDWVEPPVDTRGTTGLFVGEKPGRIEQIKSHVADVDIRPPKGKTEWIWKELPWDGILEWWFNPENLDSSITHIESS
ncbi:uncharacterized protein B0J16DRAFT_406211 [Fusarium flagelliforme]|uniref:uncharacterized protein n=1 Tax=Fusarium flagelliforme TaxID=2675880 RepID=UPI001E8CFECF|nr:uncharacterized protein B0J16DRAFT_406211 [Fusarium flagelliforme]KAH7173851.1 hypothetical protein B0J16DRAFT_406211 [Fusarium flagelliforme]